MGSSRGASQAWFRLLLLLLLVLAGVVVAVKVPLPDREAVVSALGDGVWAPWLFALLYAAATLAPMPKNVLSAVAGFVFGLGVGALLVWGAALGGAAVAFGLGRLLGRDGVERLARGHLVRVDRFVDEHGGWAVLGLRLVPVVPFTALNYGSGLTTLRFEPYLLATAVGIAPGTVAYVALGAYGTDPRSLPYLAAAGALLALGLAGWALARRGRHRAPRSRTSAPPAVPPAPRTR